MANSYLLQMSCIQLESLISAFRHRLECDETAERNKNTQKADSELSDISNRLEHELIRRCNQCYNICERFSGNDISRLMQANALRIVNGLPPKEVIIM